MKDYAALIPTATAEDVRWLVWEAADKREIGFSEFRRIVKAAERRLDQLESMENGDSGIRSAGSGGDRPVRPASRVKMKGWPECFLCGLWRPLSQECSGVDSQGEKPCEVMPRESYKRITRRVERWTQVLKK